MRVSGGKGKNEAKFFNFLMYLNGAKILAVQLFLRLLQLFLVSSSLTETPKAQFCRYSGSGAL